MEEELIRPPNNSGAVLRLEIKQKSTHTKKRKVKTWSPEEDDQLVRLYEEYPKKWGIIASLMQDRNENQCLHRYRRLSQLGAHKKIWSAEEDQTILSLIRKVGKNWKLLAEIIGTKTGKQIRERFINKLDPKIKTEQWTDEEDKLILKYYSEVGSRWSEISKKLPGRPENKIKNRFYSYIQKNYDIKYIYVNADEGQGQEGFRPVRAKDLLTESINIEKPEGIRSEKSHFKEISLNQRKPVPSKITLRQKEKMKPVFRFAVDQENIFEEQREDKPKSFTKLPQRQSLKRQQIELPSIKELQDQFKVMPKFQQLQNKLQIVQAGEKDQIFDSNVQLNPKFYIKSLIRVEDDADQMDSRYRSIRDLVSNNQLENNQNDLFYLSHT